VWGVLSFYSHTDNIVYQVDRDKGKLKKARISTN
jgi:hypothetical protein